MTTTLNSLRYYVSQLYSVYIYIYILFSWILFNLAMILQDVLKEISVKQDWDLEGIEISKLEVSKVRIFSSQRYEFKIRVGKNYMLLKFPDEVDSRKKLSKPKSSVDFGDLIKEFGSMPVLNPLKLQGPFDLWVSGHDNFSLLLPVTSSAHLFKYFCFFLFFFSTGFCFVVGFGSVNAR